MSQKVFAKGFTVDPTGAKAIDDAIFIERVITGWKVQVSISKVTDSIPIGGAIDQRAVSSPLSFISDDRIRAWTSLLPNHEKPVLLYTFHVDSEYNTRLVDAEEAIYRSPFQLSYQMVEQILNNPNHIEYNWWSEAYSLAYNLMQKRKETGALIVFDPKQKVYTNEEGEIAYEAMHGFMSYVLVSECMILVNSKVALAFQQQGIPLIYRNFNTKEIKVFATDEDEAHNRSGYKNQPQYNRWVPFMSDRAEYSAFCRGHRVLAVPAYAHFTSPIRRYVDLVNQRNILAFLQGKPYVYSTEELENIAEQVNSYTTPLEERVKKEKNEKLMHQDLSLFTESLIQGIIPLTEERISVTLKAIESYRLPLTEIARLIFCTPDLDENWEKLRRHVLQWLADNAHFSSDIYKLGALYQRIPIYEQLDFEVAKRENDENILFSVTCSLRTDEEYYSASSTFTSVEEAARVQALFRLICLLVNIPAESVNETVKQSGMKSSNARQLITDICMRHNIPRPNPITVEAGLKHMPEFHSQVVLVLDGTKYRSGIIIRGTKKDAEYAAYQAILDQLPSSYRNRPGANIENPVAALHEWCQVNGHPPPTYEFVDSRKHFVCTCVIGTHTFKGQGLSKKFAKAEAAKQACKSLIYL